MARHRLEPESLGHLSIGEQERWEFEVVDHHIFEDAAPQPPARLVPPSDFLVEEVDRREGRVHGTPGYSYRDTTYKLTLTKLEMGLHSAVARLLGPKLEPLTEARLSWRRVPDLSPVPDRVSLPRGPTRVFLRCPDEEVELTRVISTPNGVKAVVSSPRQLTLSPDAAYNGVIDGIVEVETTAAGRPALRVPVVRYVSTGQIRSPRPLGP